MTVSNYSKIIIKDKGGLKKFNYSSKNKAIDRRISLLEAVKNSSFSSIIKKLNAVSILNKNRNPKISKIFKSDMKYIQKIYKKIKSL